MRVVCVGGGPGGLYLGILLKKQDPSCEVTILERNPPGVTFGWGVVFSDETLDYLEENDPPTKAEIARSFAHWDAIDIWYQGTWTRSGGHGFSGIARRELLEILRRRAEGLGVVLRYGVEVEPSELPRLMRENDLVVACDGLNSRLRGHLAEHFEPSLDVRRSKYIWLGTHRVFDAFTFLFEEAEGSGLFQVHAYRFDRDTSTFIVETDPATWRRARLDTLPEAEQTSFLERLFARHLDGKPLLGNRSSWLNFGTMRCKRWSHENVVLLGDAVHTAHFSIGSGTKLAMEDSIALARALSREPHDVARALAAYEAERRLVVEKTQAAAQDSLSFFEHTSRYKAFDPLKFSFRLLTRSKKIGYDNLRLRDPGYVDAVAARFADDVHAPRPDDRTPRPPPPMFTPFALRGMRLENRVVVSPMCMYSARDGTPDDFHLVHLGTRAIGGAGLVMTEMTNVSRLARITPGCTGMYLTEHVPAWRRIVDFVHARSRAKIGVQLGHAGRKGSTRLMWEGMDEPLPEGNWPLLSASALAYAPANQVPKAMDRADMDLVKADYARAAAMALEAGFDLLEIHMAHGYLLASFLSPLTNARTDEHGGSIENRLRYPLEVFDAVRAVWPEDRPMSARISATDWVDDGLSEADMLAIARALRDHGCDIVDVSTGQTTPTSRPPFYGRMYQTPFADAIRNEVGIPTMAVGNISTADQVNTILAAGRADLVVLARNHLREPYFTFHAAEEAGYTGVGWPDAYGVVKVLPRP